MSYIHGDLTPTCDFCGRSIEISIFSSRPLYDVIDKGWKYNVIEIEHIIPEKIIKSEYQGYRIIKEHKKIEKKVELKCDLCVLKQERYNKIIKIKNNI